MTDHFAFLALGLGIGGSMLRTWFVSERGRRMWEGLILRAPVVGSLVAQFAMSRFCGAEGLSNVVTLSTFRGRDFHQKYGVDIADGPLRGLTARAVVVLDENNRVLHSQLVPEIATEPDYDAALKALG